MRGLLVVGLVALWGTALMCGACRDDGNDWPEGDGDADGDGDTDVDSDVDGDGDGRLCPTDS